MSFSQVVPKPRYTAGQPSFSQIWRMTCSPEDGTTPPTAPSCSRLLATWHQRSHGTETATKRHVLWRGFAEPDSQGDTQ